MLLKQTKNEYAIYFCFFKETTQNPPKQEVQSQPQGLETETESEGVQSQRQGLETQEEKEVTEIQATSDQKGLIVSLIYSYFKDSKKISYIYMYFWN